MLALAGAAAWGVGDFLGGLASRRAHVLTVLALSQLVGLAGVAAWLALSGDAWPGWRDALPAAGAGVAGAAGLAALYRGLAIGAMGIVAPISAASPVVPLAVDAARGDVPSAIQWAGIAGVLGSIAALSREPSSGGSSRRRHAAGAGLAVVAALGFGLFVVGIDASADASVPWAVTLARAASVGVAVTAALVVAAPLRPGRSLVPFVLGVGLFDTSANVLVAAATTHDLAGVVAVLSALYPIATVALARVVLGERLDGRRRLAATAALGGAVLVAAG